MSERTLDLIRHGQPEGGSKYRGHGIDDPLSDEGWTQMWDAVGEAAPWQAVVTSPLRRCRAFAEALGARHGLPVTVDEDLKEVGFGVWEGKTRAQVQTEDPEGYRAFYADPVRARPRGAEPLAGFLARTRAAWERLLERPEAHLLVVAHAGVIRALLTHALDAPPAALYRLQVDTAHLTRIQLHQRRPLVVFHNRPRLP